MSYLKTWRLLYNCGTDPTPVVIFKPCQSITPNLHLIRKPLWKSENKSLNTMEIYFLGVAQFWLGIVDPHCCFDNFENQLLCGCIAYHKSINLYIWAISGDHIVSHFFSHSNSNLALYFWNHKFRGNPGSQMWNHFSYDVKDAISRTWLEKHPNQCHVPTQWN